MRANEEVGKHLVFGATLPMVTHEGFATGRFKTVGLAAGLRVHLVDHDIPFAIDRKIDRTTGGQIQRIANLLGDRVTWPLRVGVVDMSRYVPNRCNTR